MAGQEMERIDMSKEFARLKESDQHYIKKIEEMNARRATSSKLLRRRNLLTVGLLGGAVVGIYLYAIASVRQEKFLDDFNLKEDKRPKQS